MRYLIRLGKLEQGVLIAVDRYGHHETGHISYPAEFDLLGLVLSSFPQFFVVTGFSSFRHYGH